MAVVRLLLFTGARLSEVLGLHWKWIDLATGVVRLPGSTTAALLGGRDGLWAAAVRAAILLGDTPRARAELQDRLAGDPEADVIRRALVETLMHGDRGQLVASLDESILGLRAPPPSYFAARAAAG